MRTSWAISAAAAVAVSMTAVLAGCTSTEAPAAESTASDPQATSSPALESGSDALAGVDSIVVSSAGLSLRDADSEVASIDLVGTTLDDALETLTLVLGAPRSSDVEAGSCVSAQTAWAWGDNTVIGTADALTDEGTLTFGTNQTSVETADGRTVRIETPTGAAVGDPVAPIADGLDASVKDTFDTVPEEERLSVVYDLARNDQVDGEWNPYGASVYSEKGVIEAIRGPGHIKSTC